MISTSVFSKDGFFLSVCVSEENELRSAVLRFHCNLRRKKWNECLKKEKEWEKKKRHGEVHWEEEPMMTTCGPDHENVRHHHAYLPLKSRRELWIGAARHCTRPPSFWIMLFVGLMTSQKWLCKSSSIRRHQAEFRTVQYKKTTQGLLRLSLSHFLFYVFVEKLEKRIEWKY
jgi:hypothetical protein